jgi:hypothetical protein
MCSWTTSSQAHIVKDQPVWIQLFKKEQKPKQGVVQAVIACVAVYGFCSCVYVSLSCVTLMQV